MAKYYYEIKKIDINTDEFDILTYETTESFEDCMKIAVEFKNAHPDSEFMDGGLVATADGKETTEKGFAFYDDSNTGISYVFNFAIVEE